MANAEHLEMLVQGAEAWAEWRRRYPGLTPDLSKARLRAIELAGANLAGADLRDADLSHANLRGAKLAGVDMRYAHLEAANLSSADLIRAKLSNAFLTGSYLEGANLARADLTSADLRYAHLASAGLDHADLNHAHLGRADLSGADLTSANLCAADLGAADLTGARLNHAKFGYTLMVDMDLSGALGLGLVEHRAPSSIGLDTLYRSNGQIPDNFLRDAGVPDDVIDHLLPLIREGPPIQWHSCFISYSGQDEDFARRLHGRMRQANMRAWFAPEDLEGGKKLREQLFSAIQVQDKLLLVLSGHSIKSEWVMSELRKAFEVERKENRRKLFPIRLVDVDTLKAWSCFDADSGKDLAVELREYFIPDFSSWKDEDAFEAAFKRLQGALKAGAGDVGK